MMLRALALLGLLLPVSVAADTASPRLAAALSGDWNGDENPDAVLLYVHDDGMADLVLMESNGYEGLQEVLRLSQAVWSGTMAGMMPGSKS